MNFISYIIYTFFSNDSVERNFCKTICFLTFHTLLYIFLNPHFYTFYILDLYNSGYMYCTIYTGVLLSLLYLIYILNNSGKYMYTVLCLKIWVFAMLLLSILFFYNGSNYISNKRYYNESLQLYDSLLISIDSLIFPNFEKGQISLYLDSSLNSDNIIYKLVNTILQLSYFSYYFWGNLLLGYFGFLYLTSTDKYNNRLLYRITLKLLSSWVSGFLISFTINLIIPAVSPRIYLKSVYTQQLNGVWPFNFFNNLITDLASNTYSSFPSAHNSFSALVCVCSYRLQLYKYTYLTFFMSVCIGISTLVLRYHYFVDVLCSFFITYISAYIGGFHSKKAMYSDLQLYANEDIGIIYKM